MTVKRIVILGGYGNFGKRIAESLAEDASITLILAGRSLQRAEHCCQQLVANGTKANVCAAELNINSPDFPQQLTRLMPELVIHTSGPFQGQDYRVPQACIGCGSHYIDLSDDRRFVCDIKTLDQQAQERGVLLVSGASTVPGLSSVVVDHYRSEFQQLDSIDFAIAPGNKAERGEATVKGILSYTGHPITMYINGAWRQCYGWMSARRWWFGTVTGSRWLANVDVPDLELFPERYTPVNTVRFQAGLELSLLHLTMVGMAFLTRIKWVRNWAPRSHLIYRISNWMKRFGTDIGGMRICLQGSEADQKIKTLNWTLTAEGGIGPYIPTFSAVILARKLISGTLDKTGACACLGLYTLDEFEQLANTFHVYNEVSIEKES